MQVANPNRAQFTKCAGYAIPYTTSQLGYEAVGFSDKNYSTQIKLVFQFQAFIWQLISVGWLHN